MLQGLTDADGRFPLPGLRPEEGVALLTFVADGFRTDTLRWKGGEPVVRLVPATRATWEVREPKRDLPVAGASVRVHLADPADGAEPYWTGTTDADGRAFLDSVSQSTMLWGVIEAPGWPAQTVRAPMMWPSHGGPEWRPRTQDHWLVRLSREGDEGDPAPTGPAYTLQVVWDDGLPLAHGRIVAGDRGRLGPRVELDLDADGRVTLPARPGGGKMELYDSHGRAVYRGYAGELPDGGPAEWRLTRAEARGLIRPPGDESALDYEVTLVQPYLPSHLDPGEVEALVAAQPFQEGWLAPQADGSFALPWFRDAKGELPGHLVVRHRASGRVVAQEDVEDLGEPIALAGVCRASLLLPDEDWNGAVLELRVHDRRGRRARNGERFPVDGTVAAAWVARGTYGVLAYGREGGEVDLGDVVLDASTAEVRLEPPVLHWFEGQVRLDGQAIAGARIAVRAEEDSGAAGQASVWSGAAGRFRAGPFVAAGAYRFTVDFDEHPAWWLPTRGGWSTTRAPGDGAVDLDLSSATVRVSLDAAARDALQYLYFVDAETGARSERRPLRSFGDPLIFRTAPGSYRLMAFGVGRRGPWTDFAVGPGEEITVRLPVEPTGSILVSMSNFPDDLQYAYYQTTLSLEPGDDVPSGTSTRPYRRRHQIAEEYYLHPGTWTMTFTLPEKYGGLSWTGPIRVAAGKSTSLEFTQTKDGELKVRAGRRSAFSPFD